MDELIIFVALACLVEGVTESDADEFLTADAAAKIDAYVDGAAAPTPEESKARLLALFERATADLLAKIDAETEGGADTGEEDNAA